MIGVLHDPPIGPPKPPRPPGPPGPRPPPGPPGPRPPPGPPEPPKFGRGSAALRPSRSFSSLSEPLLSLSQSANHFAKVRFNSSRVNEPSLSASAAVNRPGAAPRAGPKPLLNFSVNCSWLALPMLSGSTLLNHASASVLNSSLVSFWSPFLSPCDNISGPSSIPGPKPPRPPGPPRPPKPAGIGCCSLGSTFGGSTSHASSPVLLLSAINRAFSLGPKLRMHRSP